MSGRTLLEGWATYTYNLEEMCWGREPCEALAHRDPVLELLGYNVFRETDYTHRYMICRKMGLSTLHEYYAVYFHKPYTPIFALAGKSGGPLPATVVSYYAWVLSHPESIGTVDRLAVAIDPEQVYGLRLGEVTRYARVLSLPQHLAGRKTLFPGVAAAAIQPTRRGTDIIISMLRSVFAVSILSRQETSIVVDTIDALTLALLEKTLDMYERIRELDSQLDVFVPSPGLLKSIEYVSSLVESQSRHSYLSGLDLLRTLYYSRDILEYVFDDIIPRGCHKCYSEISDRGAET